MEHIKIELDFIPVEERLPKPIKRGDDSGVAGLLLCSDGQRIIQAAGNLAYHGAAKGWLFDWDTSITDKYGDTELTHWAEIPKIEAQHNVQRD